MATAHRLPARPLARGGTETSRHAADYRAAVERLLAAGVTGDGVLAEVLNLSAIHTPDGAAWDAAAVRRLRRTLGLVA